MTKMFLRQGKGSMDDYIILEKDAHKVALAQKDGYAAIQEDASRFQTLQKFNAQNSQITELCLADNDIENIYIALNAKAVSRKIRVIARASTKKISSKFKFAGVDYVLLPNTVANSMVHAAIAEPIMYKAMRGILAGNSIAHVDEIIAHEYNNIIDKSLESLKFKANKLLLIGVERGRDFMFTPDSSMILQDGDVLLVMGKEISLRYFEEKLTGDKNG